MDRRRFLKLGGAFAASAILPSTPALSASSDVFTGLTRYGENQLLPDSLPLVYVGLPFQLDGFSCMADLGAMEMTAKQLTESSSYHVQPVYIFPHIQRNPQGGGDLNVENHQNLSVDDMKGIWPNVYRALRDEQSGLVAYSGDFDTVNRLFRQFRLGYFQGQSGRIKSLGSERIVGHHRDARLLGVDGDIIEDAKGPAELVLPHIYLSALQKSCGGWGFKPEHCHS